MGRQMMGGESGSAEMHYTISSSYHKFNPRDVEKVN